MAVRNLLLELREHGYADYIDDGPATVMEDNQGCIAMVKNENTARSKHIETRYHYSRELLKRGLIDLKYVATTEQV